MIDFHIVKLVVHWKNFNPIGMILSFYDNEMVGPLGFEPRTKGL